MRLSHLLHGVCMQGGNTPLLRASGCGHHKTVHLLLANKADVNAKDKVIRGEGAPMGG